MGAFLLDERKERRGEGGERTFVGDDVQAEGSNGHASGLCYAGCLSAVRPSRASSLC